MIRTTFFLLLFSIAAHSFAQSVGAAIPLSGPIARMGQAVKNGIELYRETHQGEKQKFEVIYEDNKYDGKETVTALTKFAKVDQARLGMVWGNTPAGAAAPVAETLNFNTVLITHDAHSVNRKNIVEVGPSIYSCLGVVAERIKVDGIENFGVIGIDIGNAMQFLDLLDGALGAKVNRQIVSADTTQFQLQILKGKARGIKTYLLVLLQEQALALAKQAKELNLDFSVVGIDAFADEPFLKKFQLLLPRTVFVYSEVQPWFVSAYREKYKEGSFLLEAASGYLFAQVAAHLIAQGANPANFQESVRTLDRSGLSYANAQFSTEGLRISSPCQLLSAQAYLGN